MVAVGFSFPNFAKQKLALVLVPRCVEFRSSVSSRSVGSTVVAGPVAIGSRCRGASRRAPRGVCRGWGGERWEAAPPSTWQGPGVRASGEAPAEPGAQGTGLAEGGACPRRSGCSVRGWVCVPEEDSEARVRARLGGSQADARSRGSRQGGVPRISVT